MGQKVVTAQDAAIKKILKDPRHEVLGNVSYMDANGNKNTYKPYNTQTVGTNDSVIKADSPSDTQAKPDYAAQLQTLAAMGKWGDEFDETAMNRVRAIAQNGGNDGGVSTADLVNSLKQQYSKSYGDFQKQQQIEKLLSGNVTTPYDDIYKSLLDEYKKYNFNDFMKSGAYQNLKGMYEANGQNAMKDVLGEVSSRTGGLASSYATAAAQGQYNNYMEQLANAANQMYRSEKGDMRDYLGLIGNRMDTEAQRQLSANANIYNALTRMADQEREDQIRAEERQEVKDTNARNEARQAVIAALTDPMGSHMIEDIDPELVAASGMSWAEMVAYANQGRQAKNDMDWQNEQKDMTRQQFTMSMTKGGGSGSSGGGGRRRSSSGNGKGNIDIDSYKQQISDGIANGANVAAIRKAIDEIEGITDEERQELRLHLAKEGKIGIYGYGPSLK